MALSTVIVIQPRQTIAVNAELRQLALSMLRTQNPEPRVWYLNNSKLWYLDESGVEAYVRHTKTPLYKEKMQDAELNCYLGNFNKIAECIYRFEPTIQFERPPSAVFLDLGCGEALKTVEVVKRLLSPSRRVYFCPVDISELMLKKAAASAAAAGIDAYPIQGDFAVDLRKVIDSIPITPNAQCRRFFNLAANFVNFDRDSILATLREAMRSEDTVYFSAQLSDSSIAYLCKQYIAEHAEKMCFSVLKHLGFKEQDLEYAVRFNHVSREVELYFEVKRVPEELKRIGILKGDLIVVVTSYKPKREDFEKVAQKYFKGEVISNEDGTYVGFLGWLRTSA